VTPPAPSDGSTMAEGSRGSDRLPPNHSENNDKTLQTPRRCLPSDPQSPKLIEAEILILYRFVQGFQQICSIFALFPWAWRLRGTTSLWRDQRPNSCPKTFGNHSRPLQTPQRVLRSQCRALARQQLRPPFCIVLYRVFERFRSIFDHFWLASMGGVVIQLDPQSFRLNIFIFGQKQSRDFSIYFQEIRSIGASCAQPI
jgi:hypothetical protein